MLMKMLITLVTIAFVKPTNSFLFSSCSCPLPDEHACIQYTVDSTRRCPRPYNYVEEVAVAFDKLIVPKLEVLLNTNISVRGISPNSNFFPRDCVAELRSMSRAIITLAHIEYVSDLINGSSTYQQALRMQPLRPLANAAIDLIRGGLQQAEDVMSIKIYSGERI